MTKKGKRQCDKDYEEIVDDANITVAFNKGDVSFLDVVVEDAERVPSIKDPLKDMHAVYLSLKEYCDWQGVPFLTHPDSFFEFCEMLQTFVPELKDPNNQNNEKEEK